MKSNGLIDLMSWPEKILGIIIPVLTVCVFLAIVIFKIWMPLNSARSHFINTCNSYHGYVEEGHYIILCIDSNDGHIIRINKG